MSEASSHTAQADINLTSPIPKAPLPCILVSPFLRARRQAKTITPFSRLKDIVCQPCGIRTNMPTAKSSRLARSGILNARKSSHAMIAEVVIRNASSNAAIINRRSA